MKFNDYLTEAHELLDSSRRLCPNLNTHGLEFVDIELDVSKTCAERALAAFSVGDLNWAGRFSFSESGRLANFIGGNLSPIFGRPKRT